MVTCTDLGRINANLISSLEVSGDPLEVCGYTRLHLLHLPAGLKLFASLKVVPAISPHVSLIESHNTYAIAPTESRDELNSLIAVSEVLRLNDNTRVSLTVCASLWKTT